MLSRINYFLGSNNSIPYIIPEALLSAWGEFCNRRGEFCVLKIGQKLKIGVGSGFVHELGHANLLLCGSKNALDIGWCN